MKVNAYNDMEVLGQTIDDAAGEAIDKCSKVMGLGYPGGPIIDKLARQGNPKAFQFSEPHIPGLDYSFSGLKTSFLYSLQKWVQEDPDFIEHHKEDLAASLEFTIVDILMKKLRLAVKQTGIKHVAVAGAYPPIMACATLSVSMRKSMDGRFTFPSSAIPPTTPP